MSTLERKEYHETRMMRSRSPTRRSNQNLAQFDSNLDNLLEDLQNSVSRPGSSLSHNFKETGYGKSINVKASNPVTEYSSDDAYNYTSPDGREKVHGYKKEKYIYGKTTMERDVEPERARMQNSINQLDSLLDDLQQVKKSSYSSESSQRNVNRELRYGNTPPSTKTIEKSLYNEGTYGAIRSTSPTPSSKTSTLNKQTKVLNVHEYPIRVVETPVPDIDPEVLAHLDPNLHPAGNTKVTTTIKTYTYEIPGSGNYPTQVREDTSVNEQYLDKREKKYVYNPDETITTPSKSFVYNKTENKENYYQQQQQQHQQPGWKDSLVKQSYKETIQDDLIQYPPYQKPTPPGGHTTLKEEVTTIRNYQPGYQPEPNPPSRNQTYMYNESTTTKNIHNAYPPPPPPPETREYIINKETNVVNRTQQTPMADRGYPVYNPPTTDSKSYILKETHTTNYQNGYPHRHQSPPREVETFYGQPQEPINIQYSYKSTNTTENRFKGGHPESQTLLPRKFPTTDHPDGPPKRIDDLMASIGHEPPNSPLNAGFNAHEQDLANKRVVQTLNKQQNTEVDDMQKKEQPTKNVSGPPVYYPPGHEMFSKKEEEGGGGWRAQGGYAKGSGKYMYEAESGSKTKTKKGMAVVPVCLPLCCGLPCTII
ncbi:unnamed protein product [Ceutorhynchus assimilis]|uniref:Uncharacterized protein n=1 Tax=Ceutorhynchus assimilis TaxID=467358 RepID=A0A9N9QL18_9CUCU|nr:unnamed protein product [Ceutorhynchus assimilis]